jgi:uncharacterized Zn-finger protein
MARDVGNRGQCLQCGKLLSSLANARRHFKMVHAPEFTANPCPECGKIFPRQEAVKDHLRKAHKIYQTNSSSVLAALASP